MNIDIKNLITDWDGFERLVLKLCETGDVTVERDVVIVGKSGAPRQIDIVIRAKQGLVEHLVIAECKYWNRPVSRANVDSFVTSLKELNASKGIIFSISGFQEGAIQQASSEGIELFKVRSLKESELYSANESLRKYRNIIWRSIRNLNFPGSHCWEKDLSTYNIEISLGAIKSSTPILNSELQKAETLEQIIEYWTMQAAFKMAYEAKGVLYCGAGGVRRFWKHITVTPDFPIRVPFQDAKWIIPKISCDLGITLWQEHRELSRNDNLFLLAVEDCIRGTVRKASRFQKDQYTTIHPIKEEGDKITKESKADVQFIVSMDDVVEFDFKKMKKGEFYDEPGAPSFVPGDAIRWNSSEIGFE